MIGVLALSACGSATQAAQTATMVVERGSVSEQVSSSGQIGAFRTSALNFATSGTVAEVVVTEGQEVKEGEILATLDTRDLELAVVQAEANLKSAKADLAELIAGADRTELLVAENQLKAAQLELEKLTGGNATASEIASARAQLRVAQAALDALKNPSASDLAAANLKLQEAQLNLEATRNRASLTKTQAELALQNAVNSLTQAQSSYSTARQNWEYVLETGNNPANPSTTNAAGQTVPNKVNDSQRQQYYDTFVKAEASLRTAENAVAAAQLSYDNARQQEILDVQSAEQQLADAQRQLDALLNPTAKDIASAEAQVVQARAQLAQLTGEATDSELAAARMTIEQRQAELEDLQSPPAEAELARKEAAVAQAEAALAAARSNLEDARLVAPFDGIVAAVNITAGEATSGNGSGNSDASTAAIYLIDDSSFYVDVSISEVDLAALEVGQTAQVTVDALPAATLSGTLDSIALIPTVEQNVTTYAARVGLQPTDEPLRVGMTAAVTIEIAGRDDTLLVPSIAIQETSDGALVVVRRNGQDVPTLIQTGISGAAQTEVLAGLQEGDEVVITVTNTGTNGNSNTGGALPIGGAPAGGPPPGGG